MLLARVIGNVWGTRKAETLEGYRLLVVRPLTATLSNNKISDDANEAREVDVDADHQRLAYGARTVVAVDHLGAGPGELVLVAHGSRCRDVTLGEEVATKELVVAIVDRATVRAKRHA